MINCELINSLPVGNGLGESVIWHRQTSTLYWTDMPGNQLLRYRPSDDCIERIATPENLCSFGFIKNSDWLICAFETGLAYFHPDTQEIRWLKKNMAHAGHTRLNDGRIDKRGRFWFGSLIDNDDCKLVENGPEGKLYCLDTDGTIKAFENKIRISNSICWSPDGNIMYFADTPEKEIYTYNFETGIPTDRQLFCKTADHVAPDGAIVDSQGYLWSAQWGGNQVIRYHPKGAVDTILQLPVSQPTCLTFGGDELSLLFVTTANYGLSEAQRIAQPQAGDLFIFQTDVTGLSEQYYVDKSNKFGNN